MSIKYNRYTLKIYKSLKCNCSCDYCNINYDNANYQISDQEIKDFILNDDNYYHINKDTIYLYGGEPTINYSPEMVKWLLKHFKTVTMITNLYDSDKLRNLIKTCGDRLRLSVSINNPLKMIDRLNEFKPNINVCTFVVTRNTVSELYNAVKVVSDIGGNIKLNPEISDEDYLYNDDELNQQLNRVFDENLFWSIDNYHKLRKGHHHRDYNQCLDNNIIISNTGKIYTCEFFSDIYNYRNSKDLSIGNISTFKLDDYKPDHISNDVHSFTSVCANECYARKSTTRVSTREIMFDKIFTKKIETFNHKIHPEGLVLFLTEECNCNCSYCFEKTGNLTNKYMANETIFKWLDFAYVNSTPEKPVNVLLFGGEPTLSIDGLTAVVNSMRELRHKYSERYDIGCLTFTINTNLINLTDELINVFIEMKNTLKFLDISISLDGCKELQGLRAKDTYDLVISNCRKLRKHLDLGPTNRSNVGNSISLSKSSTIRMMDYDYLLDCCINAVNETTDIFDMAVIKPVMSMDEVYENIEPVGESMFYMKKTIDEIKIKIGNTLGHNDFIESYLSILVGHTTVTATLDYTKCGILSKYISVRPDGSLIPCHSCISLKDPYIVDIPYPINNSISITYDDDAYDFLDIENSIKYGYVKITSEYTGEDCTKCPHFVRCMCFKDMKRVDKHSWLRSEEMCKRILDQMDIFLEMQNREYEKQIDEYERIESDKMEAISNGFNSIIDTQNKLIQIAEILTSSDE